MPYRNQVRGVIEEIAVLLVDSSESVSVTLTETSTATVIALSVAPDDIGKIIGKKGTMAKTMRNILSAASSKYSHRFQLDIRPERVETAISSVCEKQIAEEPNSRR